MKKSIKALIILLVMVLLVLTLGGIFFLIDNARVQQGKTPLFCLLKDEANDGGTKIYIGLGYKVIDFHTLAGYDDIKIGSWKMDYEDFRNEIDTYNKKWEQEEVIKMVMVDNKIYYNTGEESTIEGRCGLMDGKITSHVRQDEIPTVNNQSNFSGDYEYQRSGINTIDVLIDNKWIVFEERK